MTERQVRIFSDRERSNLLKNVEQRLIVLLLERVPASINPDHLTFIGALGSLLVFSALLLGHYQHPFWLLLSVPGLAANWLGDSLDGRLAYYRNRPRKWYGFALDILMDWFGVSLIGFGFYIYTDEQVQWLGFLFVALYAWAMIIAQIRYKITSEYAIDSGKFGPTELRIILVLVFIAEVLKPGSLGYFSVAICLALVVFNLKDSVDLLAAGNHRDQEEKERREAVVSKPVV